MGGSSCRGFELPGFDCTYRIRSQAPRVPRNNSEEALSNGATQITENSTKNAKVGLPEYTGIQTGKGVNLALPDMLSRTPLPETVDWRNIRKGDCATRSSDTIKLTCLVIQIRRHPRGDSQRRVATRSKRNHQTWMARDKGQYQL